MKYEKPIVVVFSGKNGKRGNDVAFGDCTDGSVANFTCSDGHSPTGFCDTGGGGDKPLCGGGSFPANCNIGSSPSKRK